MFIAGGQLASAALGNRVGGQRAASPPTKTFTTPTQRAWTPASFTATTLTHGMAYLLGLRGVDAEGQETETGDHDADNYDESNISRRFRQ